MATYAIGDLQGCYRALMALLERIDFSPVHDRLWLTGDLVNRGPDSLRVLRYLRDLGDRVIAVLGNHDLHLLAVAVGHTEHLRNKDTLDQVLAAPDRDALLDWLRSLPLMHRDPALGYTMIHAGLPPQWTVDDAQRHSAEVETVLRGEDHLEYFRHMYGNEPRQWLPTLAGWERLRFITNCFTRLRYCQLDGSIELGEKGPPGNQRTGALPWFAVPARRSAGERILFGHWSTLQLHEHVDPRHNVIPLDSGCIWGGALSAFRLEDRQHAHQPCADLGSIRRDRRHVRREGALGTGRA